MKKFRAILASALLAGAGIVSVDAATPTTFNILCISRADGVTEHLMLDKALDVTLSAEGHILLVHPELTVEYVADEVERFFFERNNDVTEVYDGDHRQQSAIEAPEAPEQGVSVTPGEIASADDIAVFDLKGVRVAACPASEGRALLLTADLPSGVYIVKSGKTTLKIKL